MAHGGRTQQTLLAPRATAVVASAQAPVVITQTGRGCCRNPANASTPVRVTRGACVAIISIHLLALVLYGLYLWAQRFAIIIGVVMGSIVLCRFSKGVYTAAAVFFAFGAICDIWSTVLWGITAIGVANDDYYGDDVLTLVSVCAIPPALGAVAFMVGAIGAFKALRNWEESGAPDALVANSGGVQAHLPSVTPIHVGVPQPPPQDLHLQDNKGGRHSVASAV